MVSENLLSLSYGEIVRKDISAVDGLLPESYETYNLVRRGDVVLRLTDLQNDKRSLRSGLVREDGIITSAYTAVRPVGVEPRFIAFELRAIDQAKTFYSLGGGLRQSLGFDEVKTLAVALPDLDEQRKIADYLDNETAEIDAFIADQEKLIGLLTDRRASAEAHVLAGADVAPRVRLRFLFDQSREDDSVESEVLSVYRDYGVVPRSSRADNFNRTPEDLSRYLVVRPGYLVVNKMKAWRGSLGVSAHDGIVSPDYEVLRPLGDHLLPSYAHSYLRGPRMVAEYATRSVGIRPAQWRLYWEHLRDIPVPLPSLESQRRVVRELDRETAALAAAIDDAREAIELSKERRAALITAAVTGQIDVTSRRKPVVDSIQTAIEEAR